MTNWFSSAGDNLPTSEGERALIAALDGKLGELRPPQLAPGDVVLTGEGRDVFIVILPHKALAGLSIFIWMGSGGIEISWATITSLHSHDDLDLGQTAAKFPLTTQGSVIMDALQVELWAPIEVEGVRHSPSDTPRLSFYRDIGDKRRHVGSIGPRSLRNLWHQGERFSFITSFMDPRDPPVVIAPTVDGWYPRANI